LVILKKYPKSNMEEADQEGVGEEQRRKQK
jgi:hypothetical protein